jgi:hypothetical protein
MALRPRGCIPIRDPLPDDPDSGLATPDGACLPYGGPLLVAEGGGGIHPRGS